MELANNTCVFEISKMTVKDKQSELIRIISNFTGRIIEIVDKRLKNAKPDKIEYEYIDLFVEAFFSIKSFCVLMKEGLVSSASAITRIALEQSAIVSLVSSNKCIMEAFLRVKRERNTYYSSDEIFKKEYENDIKNKYGIKQIKIKQFFDYGWYEKDGKPVMKLKPICEATNFSEAYDLIESIINSFAHGQISIFRLSRRKDGADLSFIDRLFKIIGRIFFRMIGILYRDFNDGRFDEDDKKTIDMAYAISSDLDSRLFEKDLIESINNGTVKTKPITNNSISLNGLLLKCNLASDIREKYLLSQTYVRYYKNLVAAIACSVYKSTGNSKIESTYLKYIFKRFPLDNGLLMAYESKASVDFDSLVNYIDSRNDFWIISSDENAYISCAQMLLNLLMIKFEKAYDK